MTTADVQVPGLWLRGRHMPRLGVTTGPPAATRVTLRSPDLLAQ